MPCTKIPGLDVDDALYTPFLALGAHDKIAEHLLASRRRWGIPYYVVRDIENFAPVIDAPPRGLAAKSRRNLSRTDKPSNHPPAVGNP
ncbi:MAG: hypothetical protein ACRDZX_10070 [Acidimicrobiales bacterium]